MPAGVVGFGMIESGIIVWACDEWVFEFESGVWSWSGWLTENGVTGCGYSAVWTAILQYTNNASM